VSRIDLEGARVVVTGAGSGIGRATALRFAAAGSEVVCVDINDDSAQAVADECCRIADGATSRVCDVADWPSVQSLAAELGAVDVRVNNAGVGVVGPLLDTSVEDWDWIRSINLDGVAYGCYAFGPGMASRGRGHVVNVASMAGYSPNAYMAAYCATKSAVLMFTQCVRQDWRRHGVGVSVVCPGVIATPIARNSRYRGFAVGRAARADKTLNRGHAPDLVGKMIVECVEKNRDVVPVGFESHVAYKLLRGAPQKALGLVARAKL
jgi:NAD(P)-dependent dehydrogenase (short-subunit alcohol dehydrogenase family)